ISVYDVMTMPSWDGIDVQEEPHDLDASIKRRSSAPPVEEAEDEETQEDENLDFYHMDALSDSSIDHSTIRRVGQRVDAPPIIVPDVTSSDPNQVGSSSALRKVTTNKPSDVAQGAREIAQPQGVKANKDDEDDGINKVFEDANEGGNLNEEEKMDPDDNTGGENDNAVVVTFP
nr:hypothetical protein [Tanacetum cinerariifolium]